MAHGNSKAFKALVRQRIQLTGENYTTAMRAIQAEAPGTEIADVMPASPIELLVAARDAWVEIEARYGGLLAELPSASYDRFDTAIHGWIDAGMPDHEDKPTLTAASDVRAALAEYSADLLRQEYLPETREMFAAAAAHPYSSEAFELEDVLIEVALGCDKDVEELLSAWRTRNHELLYPRS